MYRDVKTAYKKNMIIDHTQLSSTALTGLIESFLLREGTDYGDIEISLDKKIAQIKQQLNDKKIVVVYDEESESPNLLPRHEAQK